MAQPVKGARHGLGILGLMDHYRRMIVVVLLLAAGGVAAFMLFGNEHGAMLSAARSGRSVLFTPQPISLIARKQIKTICPVPKSGSGQSRRILVTGAAGFIGFHAAAALAQRGDSVVGIDNFNDYYPVSMKRARSQKLLKDYGVPVVEADITDLEALLQIFSLCPFTHVLHLAAQAGVRYAARKPFTYINSNVVGSVTILEAIKAQKPNMPILIYSSSSSVYGLSKRFPFTEDDRADVPASLYAATKRSQELLTHAYYNIHGISATGLRFFTVYGPWGRPDMSVMSFTRSIVDGKPIRVFQGPGNTELARDFTFVGDIVAGVLGALDSAKPSTKQAAEFRLYNLGNTHVVTVTEMVQTLQELLKRRAKIEYVPLGATGDVLRTNANITAARGAFGYAPKTNIRDGLAAFVSWYFDYYGPDGMKRPADEQGYVPD